MKTITTLAGIALSALMISGSAHAEGGRQIFNNMKTHAGMVKAGTKGLAIDSAQAGKLAAKNTLNAAGQVVTTTVQLGVQATKAVGHEAVVIGKAAVRTADAVVEAGAQTIEAARVEGHLAAATAAGTTARGFEKLGAAARKLQNHEIKVAQ